MAIAQKGEWWRLHRVGVGGETLRGITFAGARWVLVGDTSGNPLIVTVEGANQQDNLPTFTTRTPAATDKLNDVAYIAIGVLVVACGDNGRVEFSTDQGQTWSAFGLTGSPNMYGIIAVNGDALSRFVLVGVNAIWGQASTGAWTQRWSGTQTYRSVAHRVGQGWVAVGDGGYGAHSPTGAVGTWTAPYALGLGNFLTVASNNSYYLAISDAGYVYRSTTGLSGSWSLLNSFGQTMYTIVPLASAGSWAAFSQGFNVWVSSDDGATWNAISEPIPRSVLHAENSGTTVMACCFDGFALVSYAQSQEDFVSGAIEPTVPPAFSANDDMNGDAVARLINQFRSST